MTSTITFGQVIFNDACITCITKHNQHPEMMKQLTLEIMDNVPFQALIIYTDGSKSDFGWTCSEVFVKAKSSDFRCTFQNRDRYSVFCSEILAIREALQFALSSELKTFAF
ncbi:RNase H domain-containing protein [Caerostris extrusa]|uniref:RNase H domain-containing protein n=1 Tax=Caerostris extrusa TaxID=172846 RepID=A0AAV4R293_CAEEX|nr:RNase H domain-containing protein [Caerostris extrusa]